MSMIAADSFMTAQRFNDPKSLFHVEQFTPRHHNCSTWNNSTGFPKLFHVEQFSEIITAGRATLPSAESAGSIPLFRNCTVFPPETAQPSLPSCRQRSNLSPRIPCIVGRVIAVTNQKGGVGKTTTAINLAASLASLGATTLLVDCDPQSNASSGVGFARDPARPNTYQVIMGEVGAADASAATEVENLKAIPAHKNLIGANIELVPLERREYRLRAALDSVRGNYEFIVLDCPPALDLLTLNALVAADAVLIPMQAEYFALEGVTELLDTIERIKVELNPGLAVEGVVITMFDDRTNLAQSVASDLKGFFGELMCETTIPRNIRLAEAPSHGKPALLYDPRSRGSEAYLQLAQEIMQRAKQPKAQPDTEQSEVSG